LRKTVEGGGAAWWRPRGLQGSRVTAGVQRRMGSFVLRGEGRTGKGRCVGDGMAQGRVAGFGVGRDVARNTELVSEANKPAMT
jgi:hypothetical protein